jgi:7-cyano-7-deazaguanine synthase
MCGIIAVWSRDGGPVQLRFHELMTMLKDSSDRGQDSTGVVVVTLDGKVISHSVQGDPGDWILTCPRELMCSVEEGKVKAILASNRAQPTPEGDSSDPCNRQPFEYKGWLGVHNGTIGNDRELRTLFNIKPKSQVDTETALAVLVNTWYDEEVGRSTKAVQSWTSQLVGGLAFVAYDPREQLLIVAKNFKPLCVGYRGNTVVWASERKTLSRLGGFSRIQWVPPYTGFLGSCVHALEMFPIETKSESVLPEGDPNKALVVTSGGIDSSTAAFVAAKLHGKEVCSVHFDYGQIAAKRERNAVRAVTEALQVQGCEASIYPVDMRWFGKLADTPLVSTKPELPLGIKSVETTQCWVPARNLIMLSLAAGLAESWGYGSIYSGLNLEESGAYADNDIEFLKVFNLALKYGTLRHPELVMALERLMKPEIIRLGQHLSVPFDKTWSCDRGYEKPCGECGCCWMRQFAFKRAGVPDEQEYLNSPREQPPWVGKTVTEPVCIDLILQRVQESGLDDLIKLEL